jgi:hypothetical protein
LENFPEGPPPRREEEPGKICPAGADGLWLQRDSRLLLRWKARPLRR